MVYSVAERVISVISANQKILAGDVTPDKTLDELGIDSFDGINLLYALEEEFNIALPEEARYFSSVGGIIDGMLLLTGAEKRDDTLPHLVTEDMYIG